MGFRFGGLVSAFAPLTFGCGCAVSCRRAVDVANARLVHDEPERPATDRTVELIDRRAARHSDMVAKRYGGAQQSQPAASRERRAAMAWRVDVPSMLGLGVSKLASVPQTTRRKGNTSTVARWQEGQGTEGTQGPSSRGQRRRSVIGCSLHFCSSSSASSLHSPPFELHLHQHSALITSIFFFIVFAFTIPLLIDELRVFSRPPRARLLFSILSPPTTVMSRLQQDQFIDEDEEEEVCPLCVEELDITDKNFKPCPCGYQVSVPIPSAG